MNYDAICAKRESLAVRMTREMDTIRDCQYMLSMLDANGAAQDDPKRDGFVSVYLRACEARDAIRAEMDTLNRMADYTLAR